VRESLTRKKYRRTTITRNGPFGRGERHVTDAGKPRLEAVSPRVPVRDIEQALTFYRDRLGIDLGWKWGTPVTHANVCRDSISLDLISFSAGKRGLAMAYIQVSGVDAYDSELSTRGVRLAVLGDRAYGMRDFEVVDPDGNRLAFGEPTRTTLWRSRAFAFLAHIVIYITNKIQYFQQHLIGAYHLR